jgi:hypothetical protein
MIRLLPGFAPNNSMQRMVLRAAADAERWADRTWRSDPGDANDDPDLRFVS